MSTPINENHDSRARTDTTAAYAADQAHVTNTRGPGAGSVAAESQQSHRQEVLEREKEQYGGVKIGSAFFGWLTATGTAVILTAVVAATGAAVGLGNNNGNADQA